MKIRVPGMFVSLSLAALFVLNLQPAIVHAQSTAFSYQGQLASNGVPVSGTYNLTFSLYNATSGGSTVAGPFATNGVAVKDGLFYVTIDFGAGVWNGQTNWLQIGIETNGATSFTTLAPRQEVLPVPYAIFASVASNLLGTLPATQLSGAVPLAQLPASVVTNNETSSVTLSSLTLDGVLNLPAAPVTVDSGDALLLRADNNLNFFSGPYAGNVATSGRVNTAIGGSALEANTSGNENTANGFEALGFNTSGGYNTADGTWVLDGNVSGSYNTAVGDGALEDLGNGNSGGTNNIAVGYFAGFNFNGNESGNIDIGNSGVRGESGVIRIGTPGTQTAAYIAGNLTLNGTLNLPGEATITSGGSLLLYDDITNYNFFSGLIAGEETTSGTFNTAEGVEALRANTSGSDNTANGAIALSENSSGNENTADGSGALLMNETGSGNTADGMSALVENKSGNENTAVGGDALASMGLFSGAGGNNNIAVGYQAGGGFTGNESSNIDIGNGGVTGESGVIRIGTPGIQTAAYIAGEIFGNGSGLTNVNTSQFGPISLAQLPVAVVTNNETSIVTLDNLTLNGTLNLPATPVTINSGTNLLLRTDDLGNFFAGPGAGNLTMTGDGNTAIGVQALEDNTSGFLNTADGTGALENNTMGEDNTAVGCSALFYNTNGYNDTAIGSSALQDNTGGFFNTAIGAQALAFNTSGNENTANGEQALQNNTSGSGNTGDGSDALVRNTSGSGNTADGSGALEFNTSGSANTAVGGGALAQLGINASGGTDNIALGQFAGVNLDGNESSNIDIGNEGVAGENGVIRIGTPGIQTAAYIAGNLTLDGTVNLPSTPVTITSGSNLLLRADSVGNFFAGPDAGNLATSGIGNTANGDDALQANTSGNSNTANGDKALYLNTSGNFNMANGAAGLYYNRSGSFNTAVGWGALQNVGLGNGSGGTNNIALGYNAGAAFSENESSNIDIGNTGVPGESGVIRIGTPGIQMATYLSGTVYANGVALSSDRNAKENFAAVNARAVLDKVVGLPVSKWNYKSDKIAEHIGPMAQDFHAAFGLDGADDKHISVVDENGVALAAIQGLNEKLEAENAELKKRLDELETQVKALSEKKQ